MVPSYVGNYTPTTDSSSPYYTGTSSPGSITPSELDTWVIIKNDGTNIEMVSLNASSTTISFYGQTGYKNFVGALNKIVEQYINDMFTNGSRHMGYLEGSSIERCNDLCSSDIYYQTDLDMVNSAIGNLITMTNEENITSYFLASRFSYYGCGSYYRETCYYARNVNSSGVQEHLQPPIYSNGGSYNNIVTSSIRPILSLKPTVKADLSGDGSANNPWVLVE